jgi:hypothetical protein
MRTAAKIDANQKAIVETLRRAGCRVAITSMLGKGHPDLMIGYAGTIVVAELKDGSKPKSERRLTQAEQRWHDEWAGYPVFVIESEAGALAMLDLIRRLIVPWAFADALRNNDA